MKQTKPTQAGSFQNSALHIVVLLFFTFRFRNCFELFSVSWSRTKDHKFAWIIIRTVGKLSIVFSSVCGEKQNPFMLTPLQLICRSKHFTIWEARAPQHWRIWHGLPGFYECNVSLCAKCLYCFRKYPLFNSCKIVRIIGGETCVCAGCMHTCS